jgi:S-adenosylmethionine-diacylgycerolhomoserine-N-methlytransferase
MLEQIADRPAGTVLEVGCGTAHNLRVLDETAPQHTLYGLDASLAMLATARNKLDRAGCTKRVTLAGGLARELDPKEQFGVDGPFDVIFLSYVLSMISSWPQTLDAALDHLSLDGRLYIVDFWNQDNRPSSLATLLQRWLFDVEPHPTPINTLRQLDAEEHRSCTITPVAQRSAYLAIIQHETDADRSEATDSPFSRSVADANAHRVMLKR